MIFVSRQDIFKTVKFKTELDIASKGLNYTSSSKYAKMVTCLKHTYMCSHTCMQTADLTRNNKWCLNDFHFFPKHVRGSSKVHGKRCLMELNCVLHQNKLYLLIPFSTNFLKYPHHTWPPQCYYASQHSGTSCL